MSPRRVKSRAVKEAASQRRRAEGSGLDSINQNEPEENRRDLRGPEAIAKLKECREGGDLFLLHRLCDQRLERRAANERSAGG